MRDDAPRKSPETSPAPGTATVTLPLPGGGTERFAVRPGPAPEPGGGDWTRVAFAAAHVVADPLAEISPWEDAALDWDRTLAFRRHLWSLGFGVAEAMDTAQRGMGLDWPTSLELIRRSVDAMPPGARIASGAGTDHLAPRPDLTLDEIAAAYREQCEAVEAAGSPVILMASRALAAAARGPEDYERVYADVLGQLDRPAILHWLGEMFDPALAGYWGDADHWAAMETCLRVIESNRDRVDGIKISLLSAEKEVALRRRLPPGVRMYTGDDFNYPDLIRGDGEGHSDALLGIFDPIAGAAARALGALAAGDAAAYDAAFAPTLPLSRHVFRAPTRFYKTGVVFLAFLAGHQDHFTMVGGQEGARSTLHLADCVRLASAAGLFPDPEEAARRAAVVMAARGVA
jgi:hypothetical protein